MSIYKANVRWTGDDPESFRQGRYSRAHEWIFDGGAIVPASASPDNVPQGTADEAGVDPEEGLVAAISSCHMLFFIDYARRDGFIVHSYLDEAVGLMEKRADGKVALTKVKLRPTIIFGGDRLPTADEIARLHHRSHDDCFIANSVNSEVTIEQ